MAMAAALGVLRQSCGSSRRSAVCDTRNGRVPFDLSRGRSFGSSALSGAGAKRMATSNSDCLVGVAPQERSQPVHPAGTRAPGSRWEQGAEVYAAAASRDQARIVFDESKKMAMVQPGARRRRSTVQVSIYVPNRSSGPQCCPALLRSPTV